MSAPEELVGTIAAELRRLKETSKYCELQLPTVYGKPLDVYFGDLADRLEAAHKLEMDKAATFINSYLKNSPLDPKAHNWLIRNGYRDISYQACIFGQEIAKEGAAR